MDFSYRRKRIRRRSPVQAKRGAEQYERQLRQEFAEDEAHGKNPFVEPPTFAEFAARWMRDYVAANNRPYTQIEKSSYLRNHLLPKFARTRLDRITTADIDQFIAELSQRGLAPKTVNNVLTTLRCALNIAREWGIIREPPRIRYLRVPAQRYAYLSDEEVLDLERVMQPGFWRTLVLFFLSTGARFGEAAALRWEDLDLGDGTPSVRICRAASRGQVGPTKTGRIRIVPLTPKILLELRALKEHVNTDLVFMTACGNIMRPEHAKYALHRLCAKAGIRRVGWHALRHTFATRLTSRNVPLRAVQELLGHTNIQTTCRYAHAEPMSLRRWVNLLEPSADAQQARLSPGGHQPKGEQRKPRLAPLNFPQRTKKPTLKVGFPMVDAVGVEPVDNHSQCESR